MSNITRNYVYIDAKSCFFLIHALIFNSHVGIKMKLVIVKILLYRMQGIFEFISNNENLTCFYLY